MSTRSNVIIKVKPEDIGKTIKFDVDKLPVPLLKWGGKGRNKCKPVTLEKPYIGIYCHWDGYPDGVGEALLENFTDYDTLLNLIAGGFCSSIDNGGITHYANRSHEKWKYIQPKQSDKIEVCGGWTEYAYIFEDDAWKIGIVKYNENSKGEHIGDIVDFDNDIVNKGHPSER